MIYLVTGALGAGKTLLTLKDVRELQLREQRPVYYFNIRLKGEALTWGWVERNPREWQEFPPGSIILVDEAHKYFPKRAGMSQEPAYIEAMAEHRSQGKDFYLITQHPADIDIFIRRRVASPGWHRHLKRKQGAQLVSVLEWTSCNMTPELRSSVATALITTKAFPTEVYEWYHSADLHTAKFKVPRQVWYLLVGVLIVAALAWAGAQMFIRANVKPSQSVAASRPSESAAPVLSRAGGSSHVMTVAEYVDARVPRIPGLAYTAPAYDGVTQPAVAPYPAACLEGRRPGASKVTCSCWTQQGTLLQTPDDLCRQVVRNGFFVDWHQEATRGGVHESMPVRAQGVAAPSSAVSAGASSQSSRDPASTSAMLSAPGDVPPKFFPALQPDPPLVGQLTEAQARDAAVLASMRDGRWDKR